LRSVKNFFDKGRYELFTPICALCHQIGVKKFSRRIFCVRLRSVSGTLKIPVAEFNRHNNLRNGNGSLENSEKTGLFSLTGVGWVEGAAFAARTRHEANVGRTEGAVSVWVTGGQTETLQANKPRINKQEAIRNTLQMQWFPNVHREQTKNKPRTFFACIVHL